MKNMVLIFAVSLSMILASCSQLDQESSPVTPQFNKQSDPYNLNSYPYEYLKAFPEIEYVKWEESISDAQWVIVTLSKPVQEFHHIFCEIIYTSSNETVENDRELIFAGKPDNLKFAVPKSLNEKISEVNIYAVYNYPSANEIIVNNEMYPFPYKERQQFKPVEVYSWDTSENTISVNASNDISSTEHVFAKINSKDGNKLVFIAQPESEFFDIPQYGDTGVLDIDLFGLSVLRSYDAR